MILPIVMNAGSWVTPAPVIIVRPVSLCTNEIVIRNLSSGPKTHWGHSQVHLNVSAVFLLFSPETTRLFVGSFRTGAGKPNGDTVTDAADDCAEEIGARVTVRVSVGRGGVLVMKGVSVAGIPVGDGVKVRVLVGKMSGDKVGVIARTTGESDAGIAGATRTLITVTPNISKIKTPIMITARKVCSTARSCSNENSVVRARCRASDNSLMPTKIPNTHNKYIQTAYVLTKVTKAANDQLQVQVTGCGSSSTRSMQP